MNTVKVLNFYWATKDFVDKTKAFANINCSRKLSKFACTETSAIIKFDNCTFFKKT